MKSWENKPEPIDDKMKYIKNNHSVKFPIYKKGERPNIKFLDLWIYIVNDQMWTYMKLYSEVSNVNIYETI